MTHGMRAGSARMSRLGIGVLLLAGIWGCSSTDKKLVNETKPPIPLPSQLPAPMVGTAPRKDASASGIQQASARVSDPTIRTSAPTPGSAPPPLRPSLDAMPAQLGSGTLSNPSMAQNPALMPLQPAVGTGPTAMPVRATPVNPVIPASAAMPAPSSGPVASPTAISPHSAMSHLPEAVPVSQPKLVAPTLGVPPDMRATPTPTTPVSAPPTTPISTPSSPLGIKAPTIVQPPVATIDSAPPLPPDPPVPGQ